MTPVRPDIDASDDSDSRGAVPLRPLLYRRSALLRRGLSRPGVRRTLVALYWVAVALILAFSAVVLFLRYYALPRVEQFRPQIEETLSRTLKRPVTLGKVEARWERLRPGLTVTDLTLADAAGQPVLTLPRVEAVLAWRSLPLLSVHLHRLLIDTPELHIQRDEAGQLLVAGMPIAADSQEGGASDWVLSQDLIEIRQARLVWEDRLRNAPVLALSGVDLRLQNSLSAFGRHRFGLRADPPAGVASRLEVRGDLATRDLTRPETWKGTLYANLADTDLAAWNLWLDLPLELHRGRGGVRLWLDFDRGEVAATTADLRLDEVNLRVSSRLPPLDVDALAGRVSYRRLPGSQGLQELRTQGLTLAGEAPDGDAAGKKAEGSARVVIPPTDFSLTWRFDDQRTYLEASANQLELDGLARLARRLPLPDQALAVLAEARPRGRLRDAQVRLDRHGEAPADYTYRVRFDQLGLEPLGAIPGASGLSGLIEGRQDSGRLALDSRGAHVLLPRVFPEPDLGFDQLNAAVSWKVERRAGASAQVGVTLEKVAFANADAAGSAKGTYRYPGQGAGTIDLTAELTRARGDAVWRYLPSVVGVDARVWLRKAITAGNASNGRLVLKGDLDRFPFRGNAGGQFLVTGDIHQARLEYADGWPAIDGIDGSLRFEGERMTIRAKDGHILAARLPQVEAVIPDLEAMEELLTIKGRAEGPTSAFLEFVDKSPVGARIDRFTEDMRAQGNGSLNLDIHMPLRKVDSTTVAGQYEFHDNQLNVVPGLPVLTKVNGKLGFTDQGLSIRAITGQFMGGPVTVDARTDADRLRVGFRGTVTAAEARRAWQDVLSGPFFDALSGQTAYRGEVRVKKRNVEVVVDSDLKGISSSLPAPLNKSAADALPLHVERSRLPGPPQLDQMKIQVGRVANVVLQQRPGSGDSAGSLERGVVAIGDGAVTTLPARGLALSIAVPRLDVAQWRRLAGEGESTAAGGDGASAPLLPTVVNLRTPDLILSGRHFHDVTLRAQPQPAGVSGRGDGPAALTAQLVSREVEGQLSWEAASASLPNGRLVGRFKQINLPESEVKSALSGEDDTLTRLPALDISADSFTYEGRRLGRLDLRAANEARSAAPGTPWRIDKLSLTSPDGQLAANGRWRPPVGNDRGETRLDVTVEASDLGKFLARLNQPDAVRRGQGKLTGRLSWVGSPADLDVASLSGQLHVEAEKGQFAKIEPGAGKLLGLLSLQALPRRITLDFRDIFSDGFAFESISGDVTLERGRARTQDLLIDGPAARIKLGGEVDLDKETQNLKVSVQPSLTNAVALGVAVVHPVIGAAAYLAQKVLQNPIEKVFSFDYRVTGTWTDPKVEKEGSRSVAPATGDAQPATPAAGSAASGESHDSKDDK